MSDLRGIDRPIRRTLLIADRRRNPRLYDRLTPAERRLFDAQIAAFEAGCALAAAANQARLYGTPTVPRELVTDWEACRDEYEFQRDNRAR